MVSCRLGSSLGAGCSSGNPPGISTHCVTTTLLDWRATYSTMLKTTPINTAYCKGMNNVARNVSPITAAETLLVCQIVLAASMRSPW